MMSVQTRVQSSYLPQVRPFGLFEVFFDNTKRRGDGRPAVYEEAYGSLYPDGYVHLHTRAVPCTDFMSIGQMRQYLETFGGCRIVWLARPVTSMVEECEQVL